MHGQPLLLGRSGLQALVVTAKILAGIGFISLFVLFAWWAFPRSAAKVRGAAIVYAGGFTSRALNGSRGTARLELLGEAVAVRGRGPFRLLPGWQAGYADIVEAKATKSWQMGSGVLLVTGGGWIAFWSPRWAEILDLLELRGVAVSRAVTKFRYRDMARASAGRA
jgi:hypothetical protein